MRHPLITVGLAFVLYRVASRSSRFIKLFAELNNRQQSTKQELIFAYSDPRKKLK
jgi:hypothetical protein